MSTSTLYNPEQSSGSTRTNDEALHPSRGRKDEIFRAVAEAGPVPTLREALESDGWKFKPNTRSYEKTFLLTKDDNKGGEFTHGKTLAEKILIAKTGAQGLVIEHGWDDVPVLGTVGATPGEAVRRLDAAAKERLAREHAHLGVTAVRGQNEPGQRTTKID